MAVSSTSVRQSASSLLGRLLPPQLAVPLRSRFGGSREPELAVLPELVKAGDTVIDVGAHKGVYAYRLARLVGPRGHVVAYEPQPQMISILRAAVGSGAMRRVELRERALSDSAGEAVLSVPVDDGVHVVGQATLRHLDGAADEHRVPVAVLGDEPMPGRVTFIKIDVEGHELALLHGARALLERDHPALLVEVEFRHAGAAVGGVADLLVDELGYTAYELEGGRLVPVARDRWTGIQLNERPGGRYVNNFVFRPATAG